MKGLKNWNVVYAVVIAFLVLIIIVFQLITKYYQ